MPRATGEATWRAEAMDKESDLVRQPSGGFACASSPLFKEYLGLLAAGEPSHVGAIGPSDALLVIDMQRDFVPKSGSNTDGGRFGVPEGDHIAPLCEQLIKHVCAHAPLLPSLRASPLLSLLSLPSLLSPPRPSR